jgi:peroxin-11B
MRLGKPMEHLQSALKTTHLQAPSAEKLTTIGRQLGYAGYLTYDALALVNHLKVNSIFADEFSGELRQIPKVRF